VNQKHALYDLADRSMGGMMMIRCAQDLLHAFWKVPVLHQHHATFSVGSPQVLIVCCARQARFKKSQIHHSTSGEGPG